MQGQKTRPCGHQWGCKTLQITSHISIKHMVGIWALLDAVQMHLESPLHCYYPMDIISPPLVILGVCHHWRCKPLQTAPPFSIRHMKGIRTLVDAVHMHLEAPLHCYTGNYGSANVGNFGCATTRTRPQGHHWGCKPLHIASRIFIRHMRGIWAPVYVVQMHLEAPLHCYTLKI